MRHKSMVLISVMSDFCRGVKQPSDRAQVTIKHDFMAPCFLSFSLVSHGAAVTTESSGSFVSFVIPIGRKKQRSQGHMSLFNGGQHEIIRVIEKYSIASAFPVYF